jgi:hypothetical protein
MIFLTLTRIPENKSHFKVSFRNDKILTREALVSHESVFFRTFLKTKVFLYRVPTIL